jgi:hypothetical protein
LALTSVANECNSSVTEKSIIKRTQQTRISGTPTFVRLSVHFPVEQRQESGAQLTELGRLGATTFCGQRADQLEDGESLEVRKVKIIKH